MRLPALSVLVLILALNHAANALPPDEIFKNVEPSVVFISNIEGFGSGVIISSSGLVLTNYHVANSPLPLNVRAKVLKNGRYVEKEFSNVKIWKVHKEYDLALLKLDGSDTFSHLRISKENTVETGKQCYVIGNPGGGEGGAMRNSITAGLVSAGERQIEGLEYIQVSAAINPGNSGGAAVDDNGKLVGIVTFKVSETEGIGFAIPVTNIASKEFIVPAEKKGNVSLGIEYEKKGGEFFDRSRQARDPELREFLIYCAAYYYRMSLAEMPNESSPYHNVGLMYFNLGEKEVAEAYFRKADELSPNGGNTLQMLGICLQHRNEIDEAFMIWLKGAFAAEPDVGSSSCAENAAITALNREEYVAAAYLVSLAIRLTSGNYRMQEKRSILSDAKPHVSRNVLEIIAAKSSAKEFSRDEMKKLISGDLSYRKREVAEQKVQAAEMEKRNREFEKDLGNLSKMSDVLSDEWHKKKVPGEVTNMVSGFGGVYTVLTTRNLKKIIIYNNLTASGFKYITIPSTDVLLAAGGRHVVAYYPSMRVLETHDVVEGKKIKAKHLSTNYVITDIVMGSRNADVAFISWAVGNGALDRRGYGLLDLATLNIRELTSVSKEWSHKNPNRFWNTSFRDDIQLSTDGMLEHVSLWCTSHSPQGFELAKLNLADATFLNTYEHTSYGSLGLSSDGSHVFTSSGAVVKLPHNVVKKYPNSQLFPVLDGNFFLQWQAGRDNNALVVRETFTLSEVRTMEPPYSVERHGYSRDALTPDKLVMASALTNRVTMLNQKTNELFTRPLLPGSIGRAATGNSLVAARGDTWTYDLLLTDGFVAKIEDGPKGLALKNGVLTWSVPGNAAAGVVEILINIKGGGEENYRTVKALIQ